MEHFSSWMMVVNMVFMVTVRKWRYRSCLHCTVNTWNRSSSSVVEASSVNYYYYYYYYYYYAVFNAPYVCQSMTKSQAKNRLMTLILDASASLPLQQLQAKCYKLVSTDLVGLRIIHTKCTAFSYILWRYVKVCGMIPCVILQHIVWAMDKLLSKKVQYLHFV